MPVFLTRYVLHLIFEGKKSGASGGQPAVAEINLIVKEWGLEDV